MIEQEKYLVRKTFYSHFFAHKPGNWTRPNSVAVGSSPIYMHSFAPIPALLWHDMSMKWSMKKTVLWSDKSRDEGRARDRGSGEDEISLPQRNRCRTTPHIPPRYQNPTKIDPSGQRCHYLYTQLCLFIVRSGTDQPI